jgi:hypothetical protein
MTTTTENTPPPVAWCPTCQTFRVLGDTYWTDSGDSLPQVESYFAQPLECGHDAGDGGGNPPRPVRTMTPTEDALMVAHLAALQAGAQMVSEFVPAFSAPAPF